MTHKILQPHREGEDEASGPWFAFQPNTCPGYPLNARNLGVLSLLPRAALTFLDSFLQTPAAVRGCHPDHEKSFAAHRLSSASGAKKCLGPVRCGVRPC